MEVALSFLLPAGRQRGRPSRVRRLVSAHVHRRRGALEYVQVLRVSAEVRYQLHACGAGADECDALVSQLVQTTACVPTGVVVIPPRRVEDVAFEVLDAGDAGQFGP